MHCRPARVYIACVTVPREYIYLRVDSTTRQYSSLSFNSIKKMFTATSLLCFYFQIRAMASCYKLNQTLLYPSF